MKKLFLHLQLVFFILLLLSLASCRVKKPGPSKKAIDEINLKRGKVISCGPADKQFGSVEFAISGSGKIKQDFNLAIELLHSFEYDEAEKVFAKIIDEEPQCAMAYWGVAMCNYHPLWTPPSEAELKKGSKAIEIAHSISQKSKREADYIDAISSFYEAWDKVDHHTRTLSFEKAMEKIYTEFPNDKEAAIFYALALDAATDPADKSFKNQKKAGAILTALYPNEPNHPGIAHYIIHTYDYPGLAALALPMARKYASIAPSSAHALHMPSHIFTRMGLWDECINSNLASISSAKCYAETAGINGHWDEELHGLDYLVYAYLQKGENDLAKKQWDYLKTITDVEPTNFKVAYAFAAIPSRYLLENKMWSEAANLKIHPEHFPWKDFPWQEAIIHFARLIGSVHIGNIDSAKDELKKLNIIYDTLIEQKDSYKANQVQIQIKTAEAWIQFKEGKNKDALKLMNFAADMEDKTEKHPVTPGEVIPARELLGDMLLQMNKPEKALETYETDLKKHPNRFNGLYGAGLAAEKSGNPQKATFYYKHLLTTTSPDNSARPELASINLFLKKH
ncbi:MAG: tetratricopeptide repeat protein [Ginsengibacter sp.]